MPEPVVTAFGILKRAAAKVLLTPSWSQGPQKRIHGPSLAVAVMTRSQEACEGVPVVQQMLWAWTLRVIPSVFYSNLLRFAELVSDQAAFCFNSYSFSWRTWVKALPDQQMACR